MHPKLALGTAQFGMRYGLSSRNQVSHTELGKILSIAALSGIKVIDTAHLYGTSLSALGAYHKLITNRKFRIVTKVPRIPGRINYEAIRNLREGFFSDLKRLNQPYVDTLMLHSASDLMRPGSDLVFDFLLNMRYLGFCENIGVSVYDPFEIEQISRRYHLDVCQFPHNIFDQRFSRKLLRKLKARNLELHSRSCFLQGLLLMDIEAIPSKLQKLINVSHFRELRGFENPLATSLNLVWQNDLIDHVVIGVNSTIELMEILQAYRSIVAPIDFERFATTNHNLINPSFWNL